MSQVGKFYTCLPYAIFIGIEGNESDGYAQCCHGGIEPGAIETIRRFLSEKEAFFAQLPAEAFNERGSTGLNWSDFTGDPLPGGMVPSVRQVGVVCSIDSAANYMRDLNVKLFLRGHQDRDDFFKALIRGFSEPTYFFLVIMNIKKSWKIFVLILIN